MAMKPGNSSKNNQRTSELFWKENLRQIFGPVAENVMWRIRHNEDPDREYKDLVSCIKFKRLQCAGHIQGFPLDHLPKKALKAEFTGNCPVGRHRFK
jgi:hypothetical protein